MAKRAALAWGEALTEIGNSRALDDVFELARSKFSDGNRQYVTTGNVAVNHRTIAVPASPARAGGG